MLFEDDVTNVSPKYLSCMGRDVSQGHNNIVSRPSARLTINRTQDTGEV